MPSLIVTEQIACTPCICPVSGNLEAKALHANSTNVACHIGQCNVGGAVNSSCTPQAQH